VSLAKIQAPPLAQNIKDTKATDNAARTVSAAGAAKKIEDAKKVGQDFEAILVRQMLAQANLGKGGYGDMANEALASAVTKGGGLGLGKIIEQQLAPHHAETAAKPGASTSPAAAVSAFKKVAAPIEMKPSGMIFSIPK
jgi:Rod binding domain-containing protein